jgi:hypothetical protein
VRIVLDTTIVVRPNDSSSGLARQFLITLLKANHTSSIRFLSAVIGETSFTDDEIRNCVQRDALSAPCGGIARC